MVLPYWFRVTVLISLYFTEVSCQLLKRFDDIAGWALREEKIFELSKARVKRLKTELNELEKFVDDYEKTTIRHISGIKDTQLLDTLELDAEARAVAVASNPILTYRMTHRLSTMIARMQRAVLMKDSEGQELKEILGAFTDVEQHPNITLEPVGKEFGKYFEWLPVEDDLEGALDAMTVLYDVYNPEILGPADFAAVLSKETKYPVQINAYHATKFSLKAFYHGYYGNAIDWANYANLKLDKERDYSISKELVHYMREFMGKSHNEEFDKPPRFFPEMISFLNFFMDEVNETGPTQKRRSSAQNFVDNHQAIPEQLFLERLTQEDINWQQNTLFYYSACQKARRQQLKQATAGLTCTYNRYINPFWYLAPLKEEVLSESPKVIQFYDVLMRSELEGLLDEVKKQHFVSPYPLKEFPDEYGTRKPRVRVTMDALIDKQLISRDRATGSLYNLVRKTEYLTGFRIGENGIGAVYAGEKYSDIGFTASEHIGGGYEAFQRLTEEEKIQTEGGIQYYLQEPKDGGEVVFGGAKTIGSPVRGSAIVWDNISRGKTKPVNTLRGSCPVLHGNKIVLTKEFVYSLDHFAQ